MKIKTEKKFKQTEIGKIPADWEIKRIEDYFTVNYGKSKPKIPGNVPLVGSSGIFGYVNTSLIDFPTIIIGRKGTAGKVWLIKTPSYPSDTTFYLVPRLMDGKVDLDFLYYHLNFKSLIKSNNVIPSVQKHEVDKYAFSCPNMIEQQKIVGVLSKIQEAIENQEKLIKNLKELKSATMAKIFREGLNGEPLKQTEIGKIPKSWEVKELQEIAYIETGDNAPQGEEYFVSDGKPFVRVKHFSGNVKYVDQWDLISSAAIQKYKLKLFPKESIVFPKSGASINLEKRAKLLIDSYVVSHLAVANPKIEVCNSDFLYYLLRYMRFSKDSNGSTLPFLNISFIKSKKVFIPELSEQEKIAGVLDTISKKEELAEKKLEVYNELFNSMLDKLMTGKIRIN